MIDCSKSMEQFDPDCLIPDFIREIAASVPEHCKVGVIAYGNEVTASVPVGASPGEIKYGLQNVEYKGYGDAGAGLTEAEMLFSKDTADKRIVLLSDGELLMRTEEETQASAELFEDAVRDAADQGISIDIVSFGAETEEGLTVYSAAEDTEGRIYPLEEADALSVFAAQYLFEECGMKSRAVGRMTGTEGELKIELPDCYMEEARIILAGRQESEDVQVWCEAERMNVVNGEGFTVITLKSPVSEQVTIRMSSSEEMDIDCYLTAQYAVTAKAECEYTAETGTAKLYLDIVNDKGESLLKGHLGKSSLPFYINGKQSEYQMSGQKILAELPMQESSDIALRADLNEQYAYYYGEPAAVVKVFVPVIEDEPQIDWFLWSVVAVFILGIFLIFFCLGRKRKYGSSYRKRVDRQIELPEEGRTARHEFAGKIVVYVVRNKEQVDYPPESVNLFARSRRDTVTLQWLLDTCGLPLEPAGADSILLKAGSDKQLLVKNNSRATALKGREVMLKSHQYPVFYNEKITFIFEKDETEIEIHYKDLRA